ncbi:MAG: flagellar motor protein MotB [Syntrophomonadaceae bacterium]|nr:flagellar motor protein MotB [Syntrophomonadaceae bacterium]MDD3889987.1 flagellar motor protein MotB [Syntrophomonadaceae bacterium]MDD4549631.1 flagellar motor protein MotB [Syntrophomonadaceae bacterium]
MARRRKKKQESGEGGQERWLITYADLITLLMIFFVLMYTMSQVDARKYAAVANSLSVVLTGEAMSVLETQGPSLVDGISGQLLPEGPGAVPDNQGQLDEVKRMIAEFIKVEDLEASQAQAAGSTAIAKLSDYIVVYEQERGLVISFKDTLLFESGSDKLTPRAQNIIKQVGGALLGIPNYIRVEGHTDNLPINTGKFPSNWELSVLRASNVVHVLQEQASVPAERLSIIGYGEYRPLAPNDDALSRSMNRRVDIVILKKKYDYFEPPRVQTDKKI